jgi:hypothetical protein
MHAQSANAGDPDPQAANTSAPEPQAGAPNPNPPDREIKLLREDEDWSFLRDPSFRQDFWDRLIGLPLRLGARSTQRPK